ncbi:MAG: hypothetical protein ACOX7U_04485 [Desulfitobacteriia bacterium]|jgi:hypothetical protein
MTRKTLKGILVILLATLLLPGMALGATGYVVAKSNGLVISSLDSPALIDNLNPGDLKGSCLLLDNQGNKTLKVYIRTKITKQYSPRGGHLADVMKLTIKDRDLGKTVIADTFRNAHKAKNLEIGVMSPGEKKVLCFNTCLPGEETDNRYQDATMNVKWIITTVVTDSNGVDNGNGNGNGEEDEDITIPDDEDVFGPGEEDPQMPGTGVTGPLPYYTLGSAALAAGIVINRKNNNPKI